MRYAIVIIGTLALHGPAALAREGEGAKDSFRALQEAAARPESEAFRKGVARETLAALKHDEAEANLRALAEQVAVAKVDRVREEGDEAVVAFHLDAEPGVQRELPLTRTGGAWRIASAGSHIVGGPGLEDRRGKEPAVVRLLMRTSNDGYGASAYSFAHVTGDPAQCKNRMDLWFCHNGDLHTSGGGRITDLGDAPLDRVRGLPVGAAWTRTCAANEEKTYVLHCRNRSDFYVALRVKKVRRGVAEIEWTLLADGPNAPGAIHAVQPLVSNEGADGSDGLCWKNG